MTITASAGFTGAHAESPRVVRWSGAPPSLGDDGSRLRQAGGAAFVVLLHVGLIIALAAGLGHQAVELIQAPFQTKLIEEAKAPPPDAPPPPPQLAQLPPPYIPPPEVQLRQVPVAAPSNAITAVVHEKPPEPAPVPVLKAEPVRVPPALDPAHPCREPDYPPMAKRLGEEGTVVLKFLIGVDGAVLDSKIESSSGHPRLDEAARAELSRCRFTPGTVDGKPEPSWAVNRHVWKFQ
jgi:protein TonB